MYVYIFIYICTCSKCRFEFGDWVACREISMSLDAGLAVHAGTRFRVGSRSFSHVGFALAGRCRVRTGYFQFSHPLVKLGSLSHLFRFKIRMAFL